MILAPNEIFIPQKLTCEPLSRSAMNPEKEATFARVTLDWVLLVAFCRWPPVLNICSRVHL